MCRNIDERMSGIVHAHPGSNASLFPCVDILLIDTKDNFLCHPVGFLRLLSRRRESHTRCLTIRDLVAPTPAGAPNKEYYQVPKHLL